MVAVKVKSNGCREKKAVSKAHSIQTENYGNPEVDPESQAKVEDVESGMI